MITFSPHGYDFDHFDNTARFGVVQGCFEIISGAFRKIFAFSDFSPYENVGFCTAQRVNRMKSPFCGVFESGYPAGFRPQGSDLGVFLAF